MLFMLYQEVCTQKLVETLMGQIGLKVWVICVNLIVQLYRI